MQNPPAPDTPGSNSTTGILLMAHGGKPDWNQTVLGVAAETNKTMPTEVAFGMADRESLQEGIDKLVARGVKQIVAVPLFVSSHSIVIDSTKYLLGLRPDAPKGFADLIDSMPDMKGLTSAAHDAHAPGTMPSSATKNSAPPSTSAAVTSSTPNPNGPGARSQSGILAPSSGSTDPNNPPPDPIDQDAIDRANRVMDYSSMTSAKLPTAETDEDTAADGSSTASKPAASEADHTHHAHSSAPIPPPVQSSVPIRMTSALDHHAVVAEILSDRAAAVAKDPPHNVLILVAHGPNEDAENAKWLADMRSLASQIAARRHYARIECATLRDDAPAAVRDAATAELRKKVQDAGNQGYHVVVVPLLLSYGGSENGLRERLDGVEHVLSPKPLLPDPRIVHWVLASASAPASAPAGN